jgi:hypothetical protein
MVGIRERSAQGIMGRIVGTLWVGTSMHLCFTQPVSDASSFCQDNLARSLIGGVIERHKIIGVPIISLFAGLRSFI